MKILVSPDGDDRYLLSTPGCSEWHEQIDFVKPLEDELGNRKIAGGILDFKDVHFINSSGLGSIFSLRKFLKSFNAKLVLARPTPTIKRLLETANIPALIPVAEDIDQAREIISNTRSTK